MFIQNKISVPIYQDNCVPRERLYEMLDRYQSHRITVIHAPAGFGKTTLVSQWLYSRWLIDRVVWYQCDYTDKHNKQFIRYLAEAFDQYFQGCSAIVSAILDTSHDTSSTALMELIAYINCQAIKSTMFLVLDDIHAIQTDDFKNLFANLCKYLTTTIHILVISRQQHTISIPYSLLNQQVQSINAQHMSLDETEIILLLRAAHYPPPTPTQLQKILDHTEGWIAAIKLALHVDKHQSYAQLLQIFADHEDTLIDYLISEFLNTQPPKIRQLLLYSSMFEEFTLDLCIHTFNELQFAKELSEIDLSELFIFRIGKSKWYRFHHLIKSAVYNLLHTELSQITQQHYHIRAANWCVVHDRIDLAIHHYMAAQQPVEILDMLAAALQQLMLHNPQQAREWFDLLPVQSTHQHLRVYLDKLFLAFMLEDPQITTLFDDLPRYHSAKAIPPDSIEHFEILFIESYLAFRKLDIENFERLRLAINQISHTLPPHIRGSMELMNMHYCIYTQNIAGALSHAQQCLTQFTTQKFHQGVISVQRELGMLLFRCGNLQASTRVLKELFAYIDMHKPPISRDIFLSHLLATEIYYWSDVLTEAQQHAEALERIAQTLRDDMLIGISTTLKNLFVLLTNESKQIDVGNIPSALNVFNIFGVQQLKWNSRIFTITQQSTKSINYLFTQLPIHTASDSLQQHLLQLIYIESILNSPEDCTQIQFILDHLYAKYQTSELLFIKLHVTILYTWYCYKKFGQNNVLPLLLNIIALVTETEYTRFIFDYPVIKTLLQTHSLGSEFYPNQSTTLIELTDSEEQILALLAQNLTYAEIATSLYISLNTVRFHVKNIYRKLGSNRRGKVIELAIQYKLIKQPIPSY